MNKIGKLILAAGNDVKKLNKYNCNFVLKLTVFLFFFFYLRLVFIFSPCRREQFPVLFYFSFESDRPQHATRTSLLSGSPWGRHLALCDDPEESPLAPPLKEANCVSLDLKQVMAWVSFLSSFDTEDTECFSDLRRPELEHPVTNML